MSDDLQTDQTHEARLTPGHEPEEIRLGVVVAGIGGIVLLLVTTGWFTYGLYEFLVARPAESSAARTLDRGSPPMAGPALSEKQPSQLRALRAAEKEQLTAYGWIDKPSGVARIPI